MAKKEPSRSFGRSPLLICIAVLIAGGWWIWHTPTLANLKDQLLQYIDNRDIVTLEARLLPEQVIQMHRNELLGNEKRTIQNTILKYYPYLLLDVKYPENAKTREGVILWGLNDGEMVLNTETWETTHGYHDCLECEAGRSDFKIMQAIARRQGTMTLEELQKELQVERDVLNTWLESAKKKHLIVQKGNSFQLHFESPKFLMTPQTKIKQHLVLKPLGDGQKAPRTYTHNQILNMTQAAFGSDFKIRSETEIFLPIYSIEVLNPDGSIQVTEWNALTGNQIPRRYLSKD
ncbi:MAG: hypothetical protein ACH350_01405 [Parachlamydiaceae bacterium]